MIFAIFEVVKEKIKFFLHFLFYFFFKNIVAYIQKYIYRNYKTSGWCFYKAKKKWRKIIKKYCQNLANQQYLEISHEILILIILILILE